MLLGNFLPSGVEVRVVTVDQQVRWVVLLDSAFSPVPHEPGAKVLEQTVPREAVRPPTRSRPDDASWGASLFAMQRCDAELGGGSIPSPRVQPMLEDLGLLLRLLLSKRLTGALQRLLQGLNGLVQLSSRRGVVLFRPGTPPGPRPPQICLRLACARLTFLPGPQGVLK